MRVEDDLAFLDEPEPVGPAAFAEHPRTGVEQ